MYLIRTSAPVRAALAFVFLAGSWLAAAPAQAASCAGVAAWNASTIYSPGNRMTYQNRLYEALIPIWNAAPNYCPSCGWYSDLGACDGGQNVAPTVSLSAPGNGQTFPVGSNISISANAQDSDGSIVRVEFFRGATSLGVDTSAPYGVVWTGATAGSYALTARATDNGNASTTSVVVNITVTAVNPDTTAPSVPAGLSSPSQTSSSISLSWSASTDNAGGSGVAGYDVYRNGTMVGSPAGTSFTDSGLTAATNYSYRVRARDNAGNASAQGTAITARSRDADPPSGKRNIGYFVQWGIYARNYKVRNIETSGSADKLTHINYAFGNVRNNRCEVGINQPADPNSGAGGDAYADYTKAFGAAESVDNVADTWDQPLRGSWNQLRKLKARHPGLKVLISLGGWTWSRGFASAARPENRVAFVASCVDAYIRGNLPASDGAGGAGAAAGVFDGIDIDWEYPASCGLSCGTPEESANFTALIAEFRRQLNAVRPGLLLTVAVGAGIDKIRVTDPAAYHPHLDYINVMSYDFHGAWEPRTNFHSALFGSTDDPSTGDVRFYNSDNAIQAFLDRGVPASKLNLGIGFYGRGWTGVPNVNNGLYQTGSAAAGTYEAGIEDYKVLKNLGWPSFTHPQTMSRWIYNGNTFWSFDTPAAIADKMQYVRTRNLGGAFFWEFSGDDANGALAKAIGNGL